MISRQGVPSHKKKIVKMHTIKATMNDESVGDNSEEEEEKEDVVDYGRKFWMQQSLVYESWPRKRMRGRSRPTNIFGQDRTFEEHDGLDIIWVVLNSKF